MMGVNGITKIELRCAVYQHEMEFGLPMIDVRLKPARKGPRPGFTWRWDALFQPHQFRTSPVLVLARRNMTSSMASR